MNQIIDYISVIGSFVFAISGALTAMEKRFDAFGVLIIAFATAVGGGTIRDILLDGKSVFWLVQTSYIYFIIAGGILAMLFRSKLDNRQKPLLLFDAVGLGLFTVTGVQIGIDFNLSGINCIILGTITGSFGGVLRDILVNEIPLIFKKEIYATVSIAGGLIYLFLNRFNIPAPYLQIIPIFLMILARVLIIYYNVSFPSIYRDKKTT